MHLGKLWNVCYSPLERHNHVSEGLIFVKYQFWRGKKSNNISALPLIDKYRMAAGLAENVFEEGALGPLPVSSRARSGLNNFPRPFAKFARIFQKDIYFYPPTPLWTPSFQLVNIMWLFNNVFDVSILHKSV